MGDTGRLAPADAVRLREIGLVEDHIGDMEAGPVKVALEVIADERRSRRVEHRDVREALFNDPGKNVFQLFGRAEDIVVVIQVCAGAPVPD